MAGEKRNLFLADLSLSYSSKSFFAQLGIENLFNTQWFDYFTPMPGRTFIFNIKFKF